MLRAEHDHVYKGHDGFSAHQAFPDPKSTLDHDYDPIYNVAIFNYNAANPWRIYPGGVEGSKELRRAMREAENEKKRQASRGRECTVELTQRPPLNSKSGQ